MPSVPASSIPGSMSVSHVHEVHGLMAASITWRSNCSRARRAAAARIDEATQQLRELAFYDPLTAFAQPARLL